MLQANFAQQEQTLLDLGSLVSEEKLKRNELEEIKRSETKSTWVDDGNVTDCRICRRPFGLARRLVLAFFAHVRNMPAAVRSCSPVSACFVCARAEYAGGRSVLLAG